MLLLLLLFNFHLMAQNEYKNLVYAVTEDRELLLDLYLPADTEHPPLIIWVHGGAWHSGAKEDPPKGMLNKGYALASVDYRLSVEAPFPAQAHDIKAAIRFLRANAGRYAYRPDQFIIWGSSAGGHLAALIGVTNGHAALEGQLGDHLSESSSVQAVIDFYGPTNLTSILSQSTPHGISVRAPAMALLLGRPVEQVPELAKLASPVYQVDTDDPPLFLAHGDQDNQVPVNQSLELYGEYKKRGLSVELEFVHGAGHGSPDYYQPEFMVKLDQFLKKHLD